MRWSKFGVTLVRFWRLENLASASCLRLRHGFESQIHNPSSLSHYSVTLLSSNVSLFTRLEFL